MSDVIFGMAVFGFFAVSSALSFWLLITLDRKDRERLTPLSVLAPKANNATLCYCTGCGCRHRRLWMNWSEDGAYRCIVCCGDDDHVDKILRWS